jgi:hypothetical protein
MMRRRTALGVLAAAAGAALLLRPGVFGPRRRPRAQKPARASPPPAKGLSPATAFVTVDGHGRTVRLDVARTRAALDAVWQVLGAVPTIAPVARGPRLLAELHVNEQVLGVTIWKAQTLVVAARRLPNVSAIVFPVTGTWRHRLLIVQLGRVVASPRLIDSTAVAALDNAVRRAVGPR